MDARKFRLPALLAAFAVIATAFGVGCQEVEQSQTVLTQSQWNEIKKRIHEEGEAPTPKYKIGANFDDKIELVGFDVEEPIVTGEEVTFTWYWKALSDMDKNWKIFVHFDSKNDNASRTGRRQNLDHDPMNGKYLTSRWEKGKIYEDVQKVKIRADYPTGPATPYIGFWRPNERRLPIKNPGKNHVRTTDDRRVIGPTLTVKSGPNSKAPPKKKKAAERPEHTVALLGDESADPIEIDGKLEEKVWKELQGLTLTPFGSAPELETTVRVFVAGKHLYLGARMEDEHAWGKIDQRDGKTWTEEVLEFFVDVNGDSKDYMEFQIAPTGTIFDAEFTAIKKPGVDEAKKFDVEGLESAVHVEGTVNDDSDTDVYWSVELKFPLSSIPGLEGKPAAGDQWAVNLYRFDRPNSEQSLAYAWSTGPRKNFHRVDKFGTWTFQPVGKNGGTPPKIDPEVIKRLQKENLGAPAIELPDNQIDDKNLPNTGK